MRFEKVLCSSPLNIFSNFLAIAELLLLFEFVEEERKMV